MIHFQKISEKQAEKLKRLHALIGTHCRENYTLKTAFYTVPGRKGCFSYICRDPKTCKRINRLVHKIAPHVRIDIKHGRGWHFLDYTPYFVGSLNFQLF